MGSRQRRRYADLSKPRTSWDLRVELPEDGMRLDLFVAKRVAWKSRNEIQQMIDRGAVTLAGEVRKASTRVQSLQEVRIALDPPEDAPDPAAIPLAILHEDADLVVLDKQPGIVVHPVGRHQLANLLSALHARYRHPEDPARDRVPHVCHRIDRDTSGVFLVAFSEGVKADVSLQFERREVRKEYLALVHGVPDPAEGVVEAPIQHREEAWPRMRCHPDGQASRTRYRVEEALRDAALVRFFPETGRTHQIRLHAAWIGHPLLCDTIYGGRGPVTDPGSGAEVLARTALHSARLELRHPGTGDTVVFEAALAADMVRAAAALR